MCSVVGIASVRGCQSLRAYYRLNGAVVRLPLTLHGRESFQSAHLSMSPPTARPNRGSFLLKALRSAHGLPQKMWISVVLVRRPGKAAKGLQHADGQSNSLDDKDSHMQLECKPSMSMFPQGTSCSTLEFGD